jgi:hypothetical protein
MNTCRKYPVYCQCTPFPIFENLRRKKYPHIRVPAAFPWSGWDKLCGKIHLDLKTIGRLLMRCKSAVFWQTGRLLGLFFTRNEKERFTGFFIGPAKIRKGIGASIGLISPWVFIPDF